VGFGVGRFDIRANIIFIMHPFVKTTFKLILIPPNYDTFSNKSISLNTLLFTPLSVPSKYASSGVA